MDESVIKLAKAVALHCGVKGHRGGWLYANDGKPICQGWFAYAKSLLTKGVIVTRSEPLTPFINWRKVK